MPKCRGSRGGAAAFLASATLSCLCSCSLLDPAPESPVTRDYTAPARVLDLRVTSVERISERRDLVCLAWTAPGDDGSEGVAKLYEFGCSPDGLEILLWETDDIPPRWSYWRVGDPRPGGTREQRCWHVTVPIDREPVQIAMRATDDVGNVALLSNTAIIR